MEEREKRSGRLRLGLSATAALAAVLLAGQLLASGARRLCRGEAQDIVDNLLLEENALLRELFTDTRIYENGVKYGAALLEAAAEFQFLPHDELEAFLALSQSLPPGAQVESFRFSGRDLQVFFLAEETAAAAFAAELEETGQFERVVLSRDSEGEGRFRLDCIAWPVQELVQGLTDKLEKASLQGRTDSVY